MVSRHRRRRVAEPRHPERQQARFRPDPGRRPRLQDGLRQDAGRPRGLGCRRDGGLPRGAHRGRPRLRGDGGGRPGARGGVSGEAGAPDEPARHARPRPGQHGHLRLLHRRALPRAGPGCRRSRLEPRLRPGRDSLARPPRAGGRALLRGELCRRETRRSVLARRGHPRRLLGREHGAHPGDAGPEPVRQGLAHLDLPGAAPAGQVRLRRGRSARHGRGLARLRRLRDQRGDAASHPALLKRHRGELQQPGGLRDPPRRRGGPARPPAPGDRGQGRHPARRSSGGPRLRRGPRARASRHRGWHHPHHPRHARPAHPRGPLMSQGVRVWAA